MNIGDLVQWNSQSHGSVTNKQGPIIAIVPPGMAPEIPEGYRASGIFGMSRNHQSYLVGVGTVAYWPRVTHLKLNKAKEEKDEAQETAEKLLSFVNGMGNKNEDVVDRIARDHRTLQQGVTRFCVAWLERCSKKHDEKDYDLRNEASCQLGKEFVEKITRDRRAMPFI